jgi:hypothetical protein
MGGCDSGHVREETSVLEETLIARKIQVRAPAPHVPRISNKQLYTLCCGLLYPHCCSLGKRHFSKDSCFGRQELEGEGCV